MSFASTAMCAVTMCRANCLAFALFQPPSAGDLPSSRNERRLREAPRAWSPRRALRDVEAARVRALHPSLVRHVTPAAVVAGQRRNGEAEELPTGIAGDLVTAKHERGATALRAHHQGLGRARVRGSAVRTAGCRCRGEKTSFGKHCATPVGVPVTGCSRCTRRAKRLSTRARSAIRGRPHRGRAVAPWPSCFPVGPRAQKCHASAALPAPGIALEVTPASHERGCDLELTENVIDRFDGGRSRNRTTTSGGRGTHIPGRGSDQPTDGALLLDVCAPTARSRHRKSGR